MKGNDNLDEKAVAALDKDLSEEQRREWNAIYASYRAESLLTARVAGMDQAAVTVRDSLPRGNRLPGQGADPGERGMVQRNDEAAAPRPALHDRRHH